MRYRQLCAGSVMLVLAGCAQHPAQSALDAQYRQSIAAAAIKSADDVRTLEPIDTARPSVTMAHVQSAATIDTRWPIWVSLPDQLRALCRGRPDALLALQQVLGLPPSRKPARVFTFAVRPGDVFRPCASSPDIATTRCSLDVPAMTPANATVQHFVLKQMMDSYRSNGGYPFTAMGWSYDWGGDSPTHQGVSEYVVKPGSAISDVAWTDPQTFCNGHGR